MIDPSHEDVLLSRFQQWLQDARRDRGLAQCFDDALRSGGSSAWLQDTLAEAEAETDGSEELAGAVAPEPEIGLYRLFEEFTACCGTS